MLSHKQVVTKDEPEENAGDARVIAQSEVKTSSPSDDNPQQPTALDQPELAEKAPEDRAYYGDHTLSRVIIPEGCESIGNGTFGMSSLTDIQIPASVRSIGSMAFCGLLKIGAITIPEGVRALGNMVFSGSNSLRTVSLPASLESVGKDIFYGCESLEKVTMPQVTFDRFKDEAWLQAVEGIIGIVPSTESDTEDPGPSIDGEYDHPQALM